MAGIADYERNYGERLRKLRAHLKISQKDFAAKLGLSASVLSEIEKEKTKPGYNFLLKLVEIFGVNPTWVLLGKDDMFLDVDRTHSFDSFDFGDQTEKIRDLLIYCEKSPLVRLSVIAFYTKFLLNNEEIVTRDIHHHMEKKK